MFAFTQVCFSDRISLGPLSKWGATQATEQFVDGDEKRVLLKVKEVKQIMLSQQRKTMSLVLALLLVAVMALSACGTGAGGGDTGGTGDDVSATPTLMGGDAGGDTGGTGGTGDTGGDTGGTGGDTGGGADATTEP